MQLLFVFLFGAVVCFVLYLSYHTHIIELREKNNNESVVKNDLIETQKVSKEEVLEKVIDNKVEENVEVVKFKARRNKKNNEEEDEEII